MASSQNRRLFLWLAISLLTSLGNQVKAQSTSTSLAVTKQVDKTKANLGDTLAYTVTLTNNGSSTVNNIDVRDSLGLGIRFLPASVNTPNGSNFNQGSPISIWHIGSLSAGQSLKLTFQAVADSMGVLYARATIPGATAGICTSIPVKVCPGTTISSLLTAPAGRMGYHWFKNGSEITDQTTNILYISSTGTYSVRIDNGNDKCNDISCCDLIIEEDPIPTFQAQAIAATCDGNSPRANGQIVLANFNSIHTYQYSEGSSFNAGASLSGGAKRIPANGIIASNLNNPSGNKQYTIRVYNTAGCYTDHTVTLTPTTCSAQPKLAVVLTPGSCDASSNLYSVSGTISLTAAIASTLTITDGNATTTVSITNGQTSATFTLGGLTSGTGNHTLSIAGNGYTTLSSTYSAPVSCNSNPPTNTAPTVANVLAPQSATVGQAFSYSIPANTFTDKETPNTLTVTVAGLANGLSFTAPATISGTLSSTAGSPLTITVTATDAGGLSVSTPLVLNLYPANVTNPGTFAITSVNTLTCVSVSTTQRQVTFQPVYSGIDGSAIAFTVLNELASTTNSGPYTLRLYTDNPTITLQAQQAGKTATYSYNWLANCSSQPTNTAPTVANALAPQSATVGQAFSYSIPPNTFTDKETPNSLTIAVAGLTNGLSFTAPATISGTPSTTVGSPLTLTVTATDAGGLAVSTPMRLTIVPQPAPVNTAPTVANALAPQSATVGQAFTYSIPASTFIDKETPNSLTITVAGLTNGLSFTAPATISGTPSTTVGSPLTLTVTATDAGGLAVSTPMLLTIAPATVTNPTPFTITAVNTLSCVALSTTQRQITFQPTYAGTDATPITLSSVGALASTTATGPFTVQLYTDNPTITLQAQQAGKTATYSYNWLANCSSQPTNTAPTVAHVLAPQSATVGEAFTYSIPANTFTDKETPNSLTITVAGLTNGLSFTAPATISGTPSTTVGSPLTLTVTATDAGGLAVSTPMLLTIAPATVTNPTPFTITAVNTLSCVALSTTQRQISFQPTYAGTDATPITLSSVGALASTTATGPFTVQLYTDNPTITLQAQQAGKTATYSYNWLANCSSQPTNTAPTVANVLAPQSATVGEAFTYSIPNNTFTDKETPNSLTITVAGLTNGLSFTAPTTISGTPSTTVGSPLTLTVTATDAGGLSISTPMLLTIVPQPAPVNTAPTVTNALTPQSATVGQAFTYSIPNNTFTDKETPNSLTITVAGLTNGLSFTAPATISGTPSTTVGSPLTLTVTATDAGGLSISTPMRLTIAPATVTNPTPFTITAVNTLSCVALSTTQRQITFQPIYSGLDGSPVSFSVVNELVPTTQAGPYTLTLYTDNPTVTLQAQQTDKTASYKYNWLANCEAAPSNTAPTVAHVLAPQSATVGEAFTYSIPANTFTDKETPNSLTIAVAGLTNGLSFTAPATISGTPSTTVGSPLTLTVTATDAGGLSISTPMRLTIAPQPAPVNTAPTVANVLAPQSATVGEAFTYSIPNNTFTDKETPNSLTITVAGLTNGLSFTAPATISGTPSSTVGSPLTLTVTATDAGGLSISTPMRLTIVPQPAPVNTAPTVANALAPQSATVGQAFTYSIPNNTFTDKETPNSLTITVAGLTNGLAFSAPATISGTPSSTVGSPLTLTVTATDAGGLAVSTPMRLTIAPATVTNPTPFTITAVNTLSCVALSTTQRQITFQPTYSGLDGSPVSFSVVNELVPTTQAGPYTLTLYTDNPTVTLQAQQTDKTASYKYNWLANCGNTEAPVNTAPTVANALAPQSATVGEAFTYSIPANTFTDKETPNSLTITVAGLTNGLSFSAPATISGTPSSTVGSPLTLTVTATDAGGLSISTPMRLTIVPQPAPVNTAPTVANALAPQSATVGEAFTYSIPANTFTDKETPNSLTITVAGLTNGLSFTAPATISGTPSSTVGSPLTLTVTATDAGGLAVSTPMLLTIVPQPAPVNTAPTVANALAPQSATVGEAFTYSIPANTFTDKETPNSLTITVAGLTNGLSFTAPATISGTPSTTVGSPLTLTVTATDAGGLAVSTPMRLTIAPATVTNPTPFTITVVNTLSCVALSTTQRQISFQPIYSGLDGSPVSFSVVNELVPTTQAGPYTLTLYTDNPTVTLQAQQTDKTASYKYNWLASCGANSAPGNSAPTAASAITVAVTPGSCDPTTDHYSITGAINLTAATAGTLLVTDGTSTTVVTILDGQTLARFTLAGLPSGTGSHTVTITGTDYPTASTTYIAPESCAIGITTSATAGACNALSNQYDVSGVLSLTNAQNGIATITDGVYSTTVSVSAGNVSIPYSLTGLLSGTGGHTITVDYLSQIVSTTYTAPEACTVSAVCSLTTVVTPGACENVTNTYSATAVVSLSNSTTGIVTVTNGIQSFTFAATVTPSATFTAVFDGLLSDGNSHTIVASLPNCSTLTTTYTAPGSCTQVAGSQLSLFKQVDKSKAYMGDTLSYTLILTNIGSTAATNVVVRDSATTGLTYVANSATAPVGTTFTTGVTTNTWLIATLSPAQSLTLTLKAKADSTGILHSTATIPGDTATVCTTIPVKVCAGDEYLYRLTAPLGYATYQWYKDGQAILGATTNSLDVSTPGSYSLAVDNAMGQCPDFSCCPFIVEEDSLPTFQAIAIPATCIGNKPQTNAQLVLSNVQTGYTYQYSAGATFDEAAPLSGSAQVIPVGGTIASNLPSPAVAQAYTIRVYNSSGCYTDVTVLLQPTVCGCPAEICVPFVIQQTKRGPRIGDAR